jgi:hypothetical protein
LTGSRRIGRTGHLAKIGGIASGEHLNWAQIVLGFLGRRGRDIRFTGPRQSDKGPFSRSAIDSGNSGLPVTNGLLGELSCESCDGWDTCQRREHKMTQAMKLCTALLAALVICLPVLGQVAADEPGAPSVEGTPTAANDPVIDQVNQSAMAQEVKTNILAPIYWLAESFAFRTFYWLAFVVMVTGVVSFALQLVLAKLAVLSKFSFSLTEIVSDALGLVVSLIGLVLTTQAATENSTFTESAFAVLSATATGALLGLVFYIWGQRQELQAVEGRRRLTATKPVDGQTKA